MKKCVLCLVFHDYDYFYKKQGGKCKDCSKRYQKARQQTDKHKKKEKERRDRTYESRKVYQDKYRKENHEEKLKRDREYYHKNKEVAAQKSKEYREKNKEKLKKKQQNYYLNNKEKIQKYRSQYWKKRKESDPAIKLRWTMRGRINKFLKSKGIDKKSKCFELIGCTVQQLKEHLESKFKPGMTWENYGLRGWHVDHIIPLSSLKTEIDIKKLCHYTNLQPLWWIENLQKSGKII